ncbi:hypothetical protein [Mangrovibacterium marinum]|uniref:hypothetical protein n=1 Tax=Mangrovibacterium marinum TaxID=1639118 RepID=UPI002A18E034|nr:hypothetical protein [Mangrovibacterium marinum]
MKNRRHALTQAIRTLEEKQEAEKELFNQQLRITFESLKPSNLIKRTLREFSQQTFEIKGNMLEAFLPLITNFISGKFSGRSGRGSFRHLITSMIQMAATSYATKHSHAIIAYFSDLLDYVKGFFQKSQPEDEKTEPAIDEPEIASSEDTTKPSEAEPDKQSE